MLKDSLYFINQISEDNNMVIARVELDVGHSIFKGHFPGQPVLPGACMLQMNKELLEHFFEMQLQLKKADDIRFSAMVVPAESPFLEFQVLYKKENNSIQTNTKIIKQDATVCCKIKALFEVQD
ncbi:MAG: 3-hydroxyacyl-ACP dehydratase [Bacteroidetes bacterium]|nr:3-hydroxyacyl-ACP dehydratase [Bacteroidota bacterium]